MLICTCLWFICTSLVGSASSAPVQRNNGTVGWVSDPNGRGTLGLLLSCILTLSLCVWSAMHLNIPQKNETGPQYWMRSLKWVLLGLLIPELVILAGWRQWLSANQMTTEINKILEEEHDVSKGAIATCNAKSAKVSITSISQRREWTLVHSMYAGMGGFVFDMSLLPDGDDAFIPNQKRLTLTASGVICLAKCGCLPDVSLREISDKSKADGLAKALVCLQAGWMVFQTIGRMCGKQPVTLLEVNTLGHVLCAFIMYLLWWHKPREVFHPTVLQGPWMPSLCAYFYMVSRLSGKEVDRKIKLNSWKKPELAQLAWFPHLDPDLSWHQTVPSLHGRQAGGWGLPGGFRFSNILLESLAKTSIEAHSSFPGTLGPRPEAPKVERKNTMSKRSKTLVKTLPIPDDTEHKRNLRLNLASEAIRSFTPLQQRLSPNNAVPGENDQPKWLDPHLSQLVVGTAGNWPSDYYLPGMKSELMGMALWFASMGYGAVHAAAWQEFFPTNVERLMWRFSCTFITCSGAVWFIACCLGWRSHLMKDYWHRFIWFKAYWFEYAFWGSLSTACGIAYIFSRIFLVVDAVVSLRSMPAKAYDTPDWTSLIPHL